VYRKPTVVRLGSLAELTQEWDNKQWGWGDSIFHIPVPVHRVS